MNFETDSVRRQAETPPRVGRPHKGARKVMTSRVPINDWQAYMDAADAAGLSLSEFICVSLARVYEREIPADIAEKLKAKSEEGVMLPLPLGA